MATRVAGVVSALFMVLGVLVSAPVLADSGGRAIVTSQDADYFGFDLRTDQNVTLDQCKKDCLADGQCRAFTYNVHARWCFLKSDYSQLKPFTGAVAGKVVNLSGEPEIGAAPVPDFFSADLRDEAVRYRQDLTGGAAPTPDLGIGFAAQRRRQGDCGRRPAHGCGFLPQGAADLAGRRRHLGQAGGCRARGDHQGRRRESRRCASPPRPPRGTPTRCRAPPPRAPARWSCWPRRWTGARTGAPRCRPTRRAWRWSTAPRCGPNMSISRRARASVWSTIRSRPISPRRASASSSPRTCSGPERTMPSSSPSTAAAPKAVDVKGDQLCVEGLDHGQQYKLAFRPGLPDAIGDVHGGAGHARHLCARPRALDPLHRRRFRAARRRQARHPAGQRQHAERRPRSLPRRRPGARAIAFGQRFPEPARRL